MNNTFKALERLLTNLMFLLVFFSYFKVIPFIDAENQPVAAVFAAMLLLLFPKLPALAPFTLFASITVLWACVSILLRSDEFFGIVLRDLFTILAPVTVYLAAKGRLQYIRANVILWTIAIWFVVSCIQYFQFLEIFRGPLTAVLGGAISRFSDTAAGIRGVSGLASEPAIAAINIFSMMLAIWLFFIQRVISKSVFFLSLAAIAVMIVSNGSGSMLIYVLTILMSAVVFGVRYSRALAGFFALTAIIIVIASPLSRLGQIVDMVSAINFQNLNLLKLSADIGGLRWPTIYVSYLTPLFFPVTLFGAQNVEFIATGAAVGVDIRTLVTNSGVDSFKPPSYGAFVALNFGILGVVVLAYWIVRKYPRVWKIADNLEIGPEVKTIIVCAMFMILGFSITASPLPWLILAQVDYALQIRAPKIGPPFPLLRNQ